VSVWNGSGGVSYEGEANGGGVREDTVTGKKNKKSRKHRINIQWCLYCVGFFVFTYHC